MSATDAEQLAAWQELMMRAVLGEPFASTDAAVRAVADYSVPRGEDMPFVRFIEWINTRPRFMEEWRSDPVKEARQYRRFMGGLDACRLGYAASSYHLGRVREIEGQVHRILEKVDFSTIIPRNTVSTLGTMRRLDFEYQAFVMAYRRSLDGFAWGLSTYFGESQSSFRRLAKTITNYSPKPVALALGQMCTKHIGHFDFVMADERGKSVRDRMAHKEAVQAGVINVGSFGHRVIGGGEGLGLGDLPAMPPHLGDVLAKRLGDLQFCIADILGAFQSAVTAHEA